MEDEGGAADTGELGSRDGFEVLERPGGGKVFVDPAFLEYLRSDAPPPDQDSLDEVLAGCAKVRVYRAGVSGRQLICFGEAQPRPALETSDPEDLRELREALQVGGSCGHCMCHGEQGLEFLNARGEVLALIGVHHGDAIRWEGWKDDAALLDGQRLLAWFAKGGMQEPLERYRESMVQAQKWARAREVWEAGIPESLRGLPGVTDPFDPPRERLEALETVFAEAVPDPGERILALFRWYGCGGSWNGYPDYETRPEQFLLRYSNEALTEALDSIPEGCARALEGAARLFASPHSREPRRWNLSPELKARLAAHVFPTDDADKAARAARAFGTP